ncbi:MAG TPA: AAA family ATPase [Candidatus Paceibacterota bacterium]|nr:AAA family ATPase [Candidatus Paceibacterota bacterium]
MYLKELTINGFKSFAKKSDLEFTTPITAIVGPNGSGKSNVAEAFRFVLGEQSVKSMRGKKGEDLIWGGSESVSRSNRASVTIKLNNPSRNGSRVFPLDFDEITIERVVNRDGTNEYSINGSKTRLKDVQELLAAANIGPTGHHIISQGEADRILSANPKERREMIEDALGLKVFQFKKAEAERKLKKTRENIAQVESLRREVAPHLRFLEKQIKKIEKSLALQEELKTVYAEYLKREDTYIAFHTDRLTEERRAPAARREELKVLVAAAKEKLQAREKDDTADALVALEEKMSAARAKRQELVRTMGQLEGQILFLERQAAQREKRRESAAEEPVPRSEVKRVFDDAERAASSAGEDAKALHRALHDTVASLKMLLTHAFHDEKDAEERASAEELSALKETKSESERDVAAVEKEEAELSREYAELKRKVESENVESREAEREIFALMNEEREVEQKLDAIDRELSVLVRDRDEFKNELQEAVSLIGRSASMYFEYEVKGEDGAALPAAAMTAEERSVQVGRRRELERMKIRLEELGTGANEDVVKEYKEVQERDEFLVHEITDLTESVAKLEALIEELTNDLNEQFLSGIEKIGEEFRKFFTLMFGGGSAELLRVKPKPKKREEGDEEADAALADEGEEVSEESEEGIEVDVKLPNKRVRGLDMLSGGERALTSIALIFAMSQVNPPLFVILDETDAALDEANSRRYGDMISALAEKSQLILITHNRETMGRAGVLYGVTMAGDGVSKLLSVKFEEAVAVAK